MILILLKAILSFFCDHLGFWSLSHRALSQGLSQEMIKGSPNLLIVGPGQGLGSSHNAIWWDLAIFFASRLKIDRPKTDWEGLWLSPCSLMSLAFHHVICILITLIAYLSMFFL